MIEPAGGAVSARRREPVSMSRRIGLWLALRLRTIAAPSITVLTAVFIGCGEPAGPGGGDRVGTAQRAREIAPFDIPAGGGSFLLYCAPEICTVGPTSTTIVVNGEPRSTQRVSVNKIFVHAVRIAAADIAAPGVLDVEAGGRSYGVPIVQADDGAPSVSLIAAGSGFTCAIADTGAGHCWGRNNAGQLGDRDNVSRSTPDPVAGELGLAAIYAGADHACGVTDDGSAWCWGGGDRGQLGLGAAVSSVIEPRAVTGGHHFASLALGAQRTCGVTVHGLGLCWGLDPSPLAVFRSRRPLPVAAYTRVGQGCGLDRGGAVECWSSEPGSTPPFFGLEAETPFVSLSSYEDRVCALDRVGAAHCGSVGDGRLDPVAGVPALVDLDVGPRHVCAVAQGGGAWCWGSNVDGQLGDGTTSVRSDPVPVQGSLAFRAIAAGHDHSCAIDETGFAWCWGANDHGQLGTGDVTPSAVPVRVQSDARFRVAERSR